MAARTVSCLGKVSFLSSRSEKRDMWEKRVKCMEKGSFPLRTENKKQRGVGLDKNTGGLRNTQTRRSTAVWLWRNPRTR